MDVVEKLKSNGLKKLFASALNEIQDADITSLPIAPSSIKDNPIPVFFMPEVAEEYEKLLKMINENSTAFEYPFVLLGKFGTMNGEEVYQFDRLVYCYKDQDCLQKDVVNFDSEILTQAVFGSEYSGYNVVCLGHTHPKLTIGETNDTITTKLSETTRNSYGIRDVGLNISVQDIIQFEAVKKQAHTSNKELLLTILMYNGELVLFGGEDTYFKFSYISAITKNKDSIDIPTSEFQSLSLGPIL